MAKDKGFLVSTLVYLTSNILTAAVPFLLLPILTRYLGPDEYGQVAMFQVYIGLLAAFVGLNVNGAIIRQFYHKSEGVSFSGYFSSAFVVLIFSFLLTFVVVYFLQSTIARLLSIEMYWIFLGLAVSLCAFVIKMTLSQYQVNKRHFKYSAIQISLAIVNAALSIYFVLYVERGAEGRVLGILYANVLVSVTCVFLIIKMGLFDFKSIKREYVKDSFYYGVNLVPHFCGIFLLGTADRYIVNSNIGLYEAGIYMAAIQVCRVFPIFFDALNKAFVPWLFEKLANNDTQAKIQVVKLTYYYITLLLVASALSFYFFPYITLLILGEEYNTVGTIVGYLALGSCIQGAYYMFTNYLIYSKKTGVLSSITIFSGGCNIALSLIFILNYGLLGVCYAFIISNIMRITLTFIFAAKYVSMPWFLSNKKII